MKKIKLLLYFFVLNNCAFANKKIVVCGYFLPDDGIGNVVANIYKSVQKVNKATKFHQTRKKPLPKNIIKACVNEEFDVLVFCDALYYSVCHWDKSGCFDPTKKMPKAKINIAYLFWETDKVSDVWIEILNKKFDVLVLASNKLINAFIDSGLKIPIKVIQPKLDLFNEVIRYKNKSFTDSNKNKFIFGYSGSFFEHKNHLDIAKAFLKNYKNNDSFELILHGKRKSMLYDSLHNFLVTNNCHNVKLIGEDLSRQDYIKLIDSFDCMVNVSAGEGYGITAREALLLRKPLILSANSAHLDLINYDGVIPVLKQQKIKANCPNFTEDIGNYSFADIDEIAHAMEYVVDNYAKIVQSNEKQNFKKLFINDRFAQELLQVVEKIEAQKQ